MLVLFFQMYFIRRLVSASREYDVDVDPLNRHFAFRELVDVLALIDAVFELEQSVCFSCLGSNILESSILGSGVALASAAHDRMTRAKMAQHLVNRSVNAIFLFCDGQV